jgi:hypothetical protein
MSYYQRLKNEYNEVALQRYNKLSKANKENRGIKHIAYAMLRLTMQSYAIADKLKSTRLKRIELEYMVYLDSVIYSK